MVSLVQNNWGFSTTASSSGAFNMALDDYIARQKNARPFLRFYSWKPYAVSIGYHQSSDVLDKNTCFENGLDIVRRPTGGRAIFHSEELTYSLVLKEEEMALSEAYIKVHSAIASGLSKLGVKSDLVKTAPNREDLSPKSDKTSCFTASARTELEYNGRKIVGSAGKKYENSLLIHGSILLGNKHKEIVDYLNISGDRKRSMKNELDSKTDNLSDILGITVDPMELIIPLRDSFSQEFEIAINEQEISAELLRTVKEQERKFELSQLREKELVS